MVNYLFSSTLELSLRSTLHMLPGFKIYFLYSEKQVHVLCTSYQVNEWLHQLHATNIMLLELWCFVVI